MGMVTELPIFGITFRLMRPGPCYVGYELVNYH
jgi:hypothetical protein